MVSENEICITRVGAVIVEKGRIPLQPQGDHALYRSTGDTQNV